MPPLVDSEDCRYLYRGVKDETVNHPGRARLHICRNNEIFVANHLYHLDRHLGGDLSFKRRHTWISEIDLCITKQMCILLLKDILVRQDIRESDHAPLCYSDIRRP